MGVDWVRLRAPAWQRHWSREFKSFSAPNLFPMDLCSSERTFRASLGPDETLSKGDSVIVIVQEKRLTLRKENRVIAVADSVPDSILAAIANDKRQMVSGTVCDTYEISHSVDVFIQE